MRAAAYAGPLAGLVLATSTWTAGLAVSEPSPQVCAGTGVAVMQAGVADYAGRICAVLARAGDDAGLIDVVYVAPASGEGMRMPENPEAGDALNCGEAPRGERYVTVRDHPRCGLVLWVERYVAHELGHKRFEAAHPGEPYGPRWQTEEGYADGYAAGAGW